MSTLKTVTNDNTPLHVACDKGLLEIVKLLTDCLQFNKYLVSIEVFDVNSFLYCGFCHYCHGLLWFPYSRVFRVNSLGSWDTSVPNNTPTGKPTPEFFWVNSSGSWDTSVPNNTPQVSDLTQQPQLL